MGYSHGTPWTRERVAAELRVEAARRGHMPTVVELQRTGRNDLACAVVRSGGFRQWATTLGLPLSGSETHRGQDEEERTAGFLRERGFRVERQTCRAPFDLLIDSIRVDVKSARPTPMPSAKHGLAHVFALSKVPPTCDLYLLVGLDAGGAVLWRYFIPAAEAHVRTITICATGKYARFKDNIGLLRQMIAQHGQAGGR